MIRPRLPASSSLGRAAGELAIIVAGVLIALAAQSWWEDRRVDEDRDQALTLLYDDLTRLEATLRDSVVAVQIDANIHRLLAGGYDTSDPELGRILADALWNFGFQIGSRDGQDLLPAYADLKSSGRLGLLPDTVRARMPGIELQLTVLSRFLEDMVFFQQNRVDPDLYDRFTLDAGSVDSTGSFVVEDAERYREVLSDPGVRNRLVLKSVLLRGLMEEWRRTADAVANVHGLIRSVRPELCLGGEGAACPRGALTPPEGAPGGP